MENIVEEYFDQTDTDDLFVRPILFVGENRSNMAQEKDWSWERCQLEKKPRNCGLKAKMRAFLFQIS